MHATREQQASALQSMFVGLYVSPVISQIAAVAPRLSYGPTWAVALCWAHGVPVEILDSRTADYNTPDDWEIEFAEVPFSETPANGVAMARSEGFEPPTPGSEDLSLTYYLVTPSHN